MPHDNITLARRWFEEVWNERREETIEELLTDESVCHTDDGPMRGPSEFRERQYMPFLAAFSDLRVNVDGIVAEGDQVVVRWSASGVHSGEGLGCKATQEPVSFRGITWLEARDGKLIEGWQCSNIVDVIRGLTSRAPA
jgi:predicted ester cyclase